MATPLLPGKPCAGDTFNKVGRWASAAEFYERVEEGPPPRVEAQLDERYDDLFNVWRRRTAKDIADQATKNVEAIEEMAKSWKPESTAHPYLTFNVGLATALAKRVGYPDMGLLEDWPQGLQTFGRQHSTIWPRRGAIPEPAPPPTAAGNEETKKKIASVAATTDADTLKLMRAEFEALEKAGKVRLMSAGEAEARYGDKLCLSPCFPLKQKDKTRLISDYKVTGVNKAMGVESKLHVQGGNHFALLWREFTRARREGPDKDEEGTFGWKTDESDAYRQVPVREEDAPSLAVLVPAQKGGGAPRGASGEPPSEGSFVVLSRVLSFGSAAAVSSYGRLACLTTTLVLCYIGLPAANFLDDRYGLTPSKETRLFDLLIRFYAALGIPVKEKKTWRPRPWLPLLGLKLIIGKRSLRLSAPTEEIKEKVKEMRDADLVDSRSAIRMAGRLLFVSSCSSSRLGRAQSVGLFSHRGGKLSNSTREGLAWWEGALEKIEAGKFPFSGVCGGPLPRHHTLFVDASDEYGAYVLIKSEEAGRGVVTGAFQLPEQAKRRSSSVREAFALLATAYQIAPFLASRPGGSRVHIFEDNTAVISLAVRGRSEVPTLNKAAEHLQEIWARVGASVHVDHVPSAYNVSDLGTRPGCGRWAKFIEDAGAQNKGLEKTALEAAEKAMFGC